MKLKCIIIDDEPLAIDLLRTYVDRTPYLELVATFNNAPSAMEAIGSNHVDILFLDINMPQITGLEFSRTIPSSTRIIFTTAYDQYAVEGFRLNALDYLLKPINYTEFLQAANKALEWFKLTSEKNSTDENTISGSSIFIKSGYRIEKVDFENILYIENQKDYVKFHLENEKEPVSSLMSMQSLEEKLPSKLFMRVHRSFIVNLDKIKTIERNCIVFGKEYIPVSESYKAKFMEFLNKNFF
ncbi:DNA-binding LytR/AlgR family response regulator [Dysgonomonas hofstadii]|uniref:DNA-binding LytR/AlgR family response regulator n=1 Tax=Dysgonomonas hofstadii TaxID=637886 RepID=A0A840CMH4_9BACT|nr:LytTR family DNA-binding domain-containing protein [Dysgonomonas hofstadii]MBB4035238.1 DNA-binding LytR/AlgR family response regulator [Dysgonomonas hofstadii]